MSFVWYTHHVVHAIPFLEWISYPLKGGWITIPL